MTWVSEESRWRSRRGPLGVAGVGGCTPFNSNVSNLGPPSARMSNTLMRLLLVSATYSFPTLTSTLPTMSEEHALQYCSADQKARTKQSCQSYNTFLAAPNPLQARTESFNTPTPDSIIKLHSSFYETLSRSPSMNKCVKRLATSPCHAFLQRMNDNAPEDSLTS